MPHTPFPLPYRLATEQDIDWLLALRLRCMGDHFAAQGLAPSQEEHLARIRLRLDCARIVLHDDVPVGLFKLVTDTPIWELIQLQISPECQGLGLGSQLLHWMQDEARHAGRSVRLSVFKRNPAVRLYRRHGFKIDSQTPRTLEMLWQPE